MGVLVSRNMVEIAASLPIDKTSILQKERIGSPVTFFHQTPKENIPSILEHGLRAGAIDKINNTQKRANKLIDFYCRVFGLPIDRSRVIYASLDDPRYEDIDNNESFDKDKHTVLTVSVNPELAYIAESEYYAGVLITNLKYSFRNLFRQ